MKLFEKENFSKFHSSFFGHPKDFAIRRVATHFFYLLLFTVGNRVMSLTVFYGKFLTLSLEFRQFSVSKQVQKVHRIFLTVSLSWK